MTIVERRNGETVKNLKDSIFALIAEICDKDL